MSDHVAKMFGGNLCSSMKYSILYLFSSDNTITCQLQKEIKNGDKPVHISKIVNYGVVNMISNLVYYTKLGNL